MVKNDNGQLGILRQYLPNLYHISRTETIVNSSPNDKFLDLTKLKAFADAKINAREQLEFVLGSMENIEGKRENAGYQHFLLFPQCFQRLLSQGREKSGLFGKELTVTTLRVINHLSILLMLTHYQTTKF